MNEKCLQCEKYLGGRIYVQTFTKSKIRGQFCSDQCRQDWNEYWEDQKTNEMIDLALGN